MIDKASVERLAKACEVFARQWRSGNPPGHDATLELHRSLKKTTPELHRPKLDQVDALYEALVLIESEREVLERSFLPEPDRGEQDLLSEYERVIVAIKAALELAHAPL